MQADEVLRPLDAGGQVGDRQGRGVGAEQRVGRDDVLDLLEDLLLEIGRLEHRLDHQIAAGERLRVCGRGDAGQQRVGLLLRGSAPLEGLGLELLGVRLPLVGGGLLDVLEDDLDAGLGADVGDAGAHHARAEDADLGEPGARDLGAVGRLRAGAAGGAVLHVEEERLDHVLRDGAGDEGDEVARLDLLGGGEVDLGALDGGGHDGARRRGGRALGLLAHVGGERRQDARQRGVVDRAAGQSPALAVPRLGGLGVGGEPCLGGVDELLGLDDLVDQPGLEGLVGREGTAGHEDVGHGLGEAEHPDGADDAAAAGQQAEGDLGQSDLGAAGVGHDAMVAREREFEAAAEGGAVDRGHDGHAAGLEGTHAALDTHRPLVELLGLLGAGLDHGLEVAAAEEALLGGGEDDSLDGVLLGHDAVDRGGEVVDEAGVHRVGAVVGVVHGEGDDAVAVLLPPEHVVAHWFCTPVSLWCRWVRRVR